jgi:hypothetical protein
MTKARDLANLISGGFTEADIPNLSASKITSGTFANARLSEGSVTQHVTSFDDNKLVNDISTLALRQASNENKVGYNTNSMTVDVFQDESKIDTKTNIVVLDEKLGVKEQQNEVRYNFEQTGTPTNFGSGLTGIDTTTVPSSTDTGAAKFGSRGFTATDAKYVFFKKNSGSIIGANDDFTFSGWFNTRGLSDNTYYDMWHLQGTNARQSMSKWRSGYSNGGWQYYYNTGSGDNNTYLYGNGDNTWHWILVVRENGTLSVYDGTSTSASRRATYSSNTQAFHTVCWGNQESGTGNGGCHVDDAYLSVGNADYDPTATSVTIPTSAVTDQFTFNATGNFTSTNTTAPSSVSSMGGIITYENTSGTATLNTDLVLKLSANGGTNYSTATLTAMPDFSSGIKMAKVNDLSVTAGTSLKYKVELANQADGSKETKIRGVSLQY